jgi:ferric-dicitrate binding protein FerR (iron transport regulator)
MKARDLFPHGAAIVLLSMLAASPASAQSSGLGCALQAVAGTSRHVLACPGGVRITAEAGARYTLTDRNQDGSADGVALRSKALLLEVPRGTRGGFVVVTPQAIAAVRGTVWAVDAARGKTSVFVVEGRVAVQRPTSNARVVLGPGQGIDVERGAGPLEVKRWGAARAAALLARLGR